jgi:serine/threonine-protein kinase RsbW
MTGNDTEPIQNRIQNRVQDRIQDRVVLSSSLPEITRVSAWVEALALQYEIAESVQFAINLCLEEALANVIRHGYENQTGRSIAVSFTVSGEGDFVFTIEDDAPPFNPLETPVLPELDEQGELRIGGHGIRLIREFADTLEYEPTPTGNRLHFGFSNKVSPAPAKKAG